jgi:acetyl-CoA acetyltransferase
MYRWHIMDPVRFEQDLRVTIQALGWRAQGPPLSAAAGRHRLGGLLVPDAADRAVSGAAGPRLSGSHLTQQIYDKSGVAPDDVDVAELHDCFTVNEVLSYEGLQFVKPGEAERFIRDGDNTYGGGIVTNPSGGLLSKGHPLGATGLAQCAELVWQLRGEAGLRQVEYARIALQHNLGLGGACVVTLYERP